MRIGVGDRGSVAISCPKFALSIWATVPAVELADTLFEVLLASGFDGVPQAIIFIAKKRESTEIDTLRLFNLCFFDRMGLFLLIFTFAIAQLRDRPFHHRQQS